MYVKSRLWKTNTLHSVVIGRRTWYQPVFDLPAVLITVLLASWETQTKLPNS